MSTEEKRCPVAKMQYCVREECMFWDNGTKFRKEGCMIRRMVVQLAIWAEAQP